MPKLVDDPRLEKMEDLVEALHPNRRVENVTEAFKAAEAEAAAMAEATDTSEEWYHLSSRLGRYRYERFG